MNLWKAVTLESVQNIIQYNSKCVASLYSIMYIVQISLVIKAEDY